MDDADTPLLLGERGGGGRGGRGRSRGSSGRGNNSREETTAATATTQAVVPDVPFLSSGPLPEEEAEETTEFSRLIAQQSTSFNEYDRDVILNAQHNVNNPLQILSQRYDPSSATRSNIARSQQHNYYRTYIALWTLSILHLGFVWGSYMADSWSETRLYVSLFGKMETSILIRNSNLASIVLSSLDNNNMDTFHLPLLAIVVCLTCLILPCAFMIASPSWIITGSSSIGSSHHHNNNQRQQSNNNNNIFTTRNVLELSIRFGYMIVYVFVIMNIAVSFIELSWTDTTITIENLPKAGLACFLFAITCAVTFVMVLRLYPLPTTTNYNHKNETSWNNKPAVDLPLDHHNQGTNTATSGGGNNNNTNHNRPEQQQQQPSGSTSRSPVTPPPPHAFRLNNNNNNNIQQQDIITSNDDVVVESEVSMTVLEDSPIPSSSTTTQQQQQQQQQTPQQAPSSTFTATTIQRRPMLCSIPRRISFCYKVLIFQIGLLAVVFWMPSMYLPILSYNYSGFVSDLMYYNNPNQDVEETTTQAAATKLIIYLSDIPQMIWTATTTSTSVAGGSTSETAQSNVLICIMTVVFVMSIFVFPVLGTLLGIFTWIGEGRWTKRSRTYLYCIQPALGGLVFITVLLLLVAAGGGGGGNKTNDDKNNSAISMLFDSLLVGNGSSDDGLCTQIKKWNIIKQQRDCLALNVQLLPGAWFYIIQTILLEVFVAATLLWSESS